LKEGARGTGWNWVELGGTGWNWDEGIIRLRSFSKEK